jgi:hypothetical protein
LRHKLRHKKKTCFPEAQAIESAPFRLSVAAMQMLRTHLRIATYGNLRRLDQQHPNKPVPLFADQSQPLMPATLCDV